jgi:hypothetical protein
MAAAGITPDSWKEICLIGIIPNGGSEVQFAGLTEDITAMDWMEKDIEGMGDGTTKIKTEGILLPKFIVYAEIYDFSTTYGETYDKGKLVKTNTTIVGIQIRLVNVDNSQYIVASGQGTSTQVGEGFFKNPNMSFDQSTVGIATQRALEKATFNLIGRMEKNAW